MRLQPVPHSLSCSLYLSQGSHVITLLTTVMCRGREPPELPPSGRVKQGQGLLTSDDDPAVPLVLMPPYAPLLRASSHCRSLLGFEPLPQLTRKKKKKKKSQTSSEGRCGALSLYLSLPLAPRARGRPPLLFQKSHC